MIEALITLRLVSDYLWEYKLFGAASALAFLLASALVLLTSKKRIRVVGADLLFVLFSLSVLASEVATPKNSSPVDAAKFIAYFFIYIGGRIGPTRLHKPFCLAFTSFLALVGFSIAALLGVGYQYWGSVATFSGGYFFKTDMAISALILLSIIASTVTSRGLLLVSTALALYVVFKTNARIALPLTIAIPVLASLVRAGVIRRINLKAVIYFFILGAAGIGLFFLIDFRTLGLLGFDFSDPFSAANTQGRTVIWAALLEAYSQADSLRKLVGLGLGGDAAATMIFSESAQLEGVRAHNSYLYLLVCTGIVGSALFYLVLFSILRRLPILLTNGDRDSIVISNLFLTLAFVFLWTSLTTEIIIRAQLMALFFYIGGVVVQRNLIIKRRPAGFRNESPYCA